jgi:hypothetical protein
MEKWEYNELVHQLFIDFRDVSEEGNTVKYCHRVLRTNEISYTD